jgi:CubicO group peptidase (beta-lactamase class C family)
MHSSKRGPVVLEIAAATLAVALLGFGIWSAKVMLPRATGYAAKIGCSAAFVSGRPVAAVREQELAQVAFVHVEFDEQARTVEASVAGIARQRAVHQGSVGCVRSRSEPSAAITQREPKLVGEVDHSQPWPLGDGEDRRPDPDGLDRAALDAIVADAFAEPEPDAPRNTRALLVAYEGRLVAERYAEGFDATMALPGWSMAKSVTNALFGLLVGRGELELDAPAPVPEWHEQPGDPRAAITSSQLLRMSSGLAFEERYGPFGPGSDMLFVDESCAALAIAAPLIAEPGTHYAYSSGTANIIARIIRDRFSSPEAQGQFFHEALFEPLGLRSAVLELDATGTFVGSSFALMTARDWARLGQLYLDDGLWNGRRILPEGWVEYSRTPAPAAPHGEYGALFQTNAGRWRLPSAPEDAFEMVGYEGQSVLIVPSRRAVIVRLGLTRGASWDTDELARRVLATLPPDG